MKPELDQFDDFMRDIVQDAGIERAPANFTQAVMGQISADLAKAKRASKPLISRRGWIGIAASIALIAVGMVAFLQPATTTSPTTQKFANALDSFTGLFDQLQFPMVLVLTALAITLLFGLERMFKHRKNSAL